MRSFSFYFRLLLPVCSATVVVAVDASTASQILTLPFHSELNPDLNETRLLSFTSSFVQALFLFQFLTFHQITHTFNSNKFRSINEIDYKKLNPFLRFVFFFSFENFIFVFIYYYLLILL